MRTDQERIILLHKRAEELQKQKERIQMEAIGASCFLLFVCLIYLMTMFGSIGHDLLTSPVAATSMLTDDVGGYVLAAVVSFMAGVLLTAFLLYKKGKGPENKRPSPEDDPEEDDMY